MRFLLGAFESACNPASYSLIADYFPPAYRSTANAIETSGSYVGGGIASICILLIKAYGWRAMYQTIGVAGMIMGILIMLLIKEPQRGRYDLQESFKKKSDVGSCDIDKTEEEIDKRSPVKQFMDALKQVITNPTARLVTIAGCFRFWETFSIVYFLPSFFQKVYPLYKSEYGLYSAAILSICGFLSTVIGGLISDKFEKRSKMTKALVCMLGSGIGIPVIAACVLTTGNFYLSLVFMALKYLISECWMSPAITMM